MRPTTVPSILLSSFLAVLLAALVFAHPSNQDATKQHKQEQEKANKAQAKTDKGKDQSLDTKEQKKTDKAQNKADKAKEKEPPVQYDPVLR